MSASPNPSPALAAPLSPPSNTASAKSNSELAALLAESYAEADNLRKQLNSAIRRAERAERSLAAATPSASHAAIQDLESRLEKAENARDEADARRARIQEYWQDLDRWFCYVDAKIQENRFLFTRIVLENGGHHLNVTRLPMVNDLVTLQNQNHVVAPPHLSTRPSSSQLASRPSMNSRSTTFGLPPPAPNPRVRQRTESLTGPGVQPMQKKPRSDGERRSREERATYSESPNTAPIYLGSTNQQQSPARSPVGYPPFPPNYPPPHGQVEFSQAPPQHSTRSSQSRHRQRTRHGRSHSTSHSDSRSRSRSRSRGSSRSKSIDDMILETAEGGGMLNRRASMDPQHLSGQSSRRRANLEHYPYPRTESYQSHLSPQHAHPHSENASGSHLSQQPQPQSLPSYPSLPPEASGCAGGAVGGTVQTYQTHIFAPVVTGAPVKKLKFSPAGIALPANGSEVSAPSGPPNATGGPPGQGTTTYPPTNAHGQRICRQCGQPGRYKEGKCVEKWGPGPEGPGTCCDRCRKKMKRVERRGTHDGHSIYGSPSSSMLQQRLSQSHSLVLPDTQRRSPMSSLGTDRPIQRTDTLVAPSSSGTVGTLILADAQDNDRERTPSAHSAHHVSLSPQTATAEGGEEVKKSTVSSSDESKERDRRESTSQQGGSKRGSPPQEQDSDGRRKGKIERADAQGHVDVEADPDAELLEAVDAAEANSAGSGWLKEEDV